jgi:hypothetical protein
MILLDLLPINQPVPFHVLERVAFDLYHSAPDLKEEKRGTPADDKVVPRHGLRCFEGFGDNREEF